MLVNDSIAEYNVSQEKKKQSRNYLRWHYRQDSYLDMKSQLVGLKQAKNRVSDWSFRRNAIVC